MGTIPLRTSGRHLLRTAGSTAPFEALEPRQLLTVQFEPIESIASVESGVAILTQDFDQDGFTDIAIAHNDRNAVTVLFGDAGSTFSRRTSLFTTGRPAAMASEDYNRDEFLDLAIVTQDGDINVFLTDGAGRFRRAAPANTVNINTDGVTRSLGTVDVGPDGDWDLVGLSEVGFSVVVNEGDGEFDGVINNPGTNPPPLANEANFASSFADLGLSFEGRDLAVVFTEGDIKELSVIIAGQDTEQLGRGIVTVFREAFPDGVNNPIGPGFVQNFLLTSFVDLPWAPSAVAQGDVTRDGLFDIVVVAETEAEFAVLTADRGAYTYTSYSLGSVNGGNDIALVDLDNDGDLDVVIGADQAIIVFENLGFGRFAPAATQTVAVDIDAIAFVDYDFDGRPEIVGTSTTEDILIFQNLRFVASIVPTAVTPGSAVDSALRFGVNPQVTARNTAGDPIAFFGNQFAGFGVADIRRETTGGVIAGNARSFFDPKDGRGYAVAQSANGLILYRDNGSFFTERNIADENRLTVSFTEVIPVVGTDGIVRIFAVSSAGQIFIFEQNGSTNDRGEFFWFARNLSTNDLTDSQFGTPSFASPLVSYVTPWNSIHIAGLDADGRIFTVWTSNALNGEYTSNDLTEVSSAPALVGNLAVFVQPWGAINLAGLDANGEIIVTWWAPGFGGLWRNDNISDALGVTAPSLIGSTLTAFVTPWAGQNIVGLNGSGELVTVWWSPASGVWSASNLNEVTPDAVSLAAGPLSAESGSGSIYIFGTSLEGDVTSYAFSGANFWRVFNLSEDAVAR